jgi:bacteriocin biosynthesis cyclodehydratase domain-containing protein
MLTELAPRLLGYQTVKELCSTLSPQEQRVAQLLISNLLEKGVAISHVCEETDLSPAVRERFAPQIEYIEHFADNPVRRFVEFRRSRILLTGSGIPLSSLAISLARNGVETVVIEKDAPLIEEDPEFVALVEELDRSGVSISVERIPLRDQLGEGSQPPTTICYVSDAADFLKISSLNEFSLKSRIHFLSGYLLAGKALVGPLVRPGFRGCWMCALLRYSANIQPELRGSIWKYLALGQRWIHETRMPSNPCLKILANLMGLELFRHCAKHLPPESKGTVVYVDLETLETSKSRILTHPQCPHCCTSTPEDDRTFLLNGCVGSPREMLPPKRKLELLAPMIDVELGIVRRFSDDDLPQLPIFRSSVIVSGVGSDNDVLVGGYSIESNAGARLDATLSALRLYVSSTPNNSRMWRATRGEVLERDVLPLSEASLSNWLGGPSIPAHRRTLWMYGKSFFTGGMYALNAEAVYCNCSVNSGDFEKSKAGLGIGFSFEEACNEAILSLFAQEVLKRVSVHEIGLIETMVDAIKDKDRDLQYLQDTFSRMERPFKLMVFTYSGRGALALAFSPEDAQNQARIVIGTALHLQDAIVKALTDLLGLDVGGASARTVEHCLPQALGYPLDLLNSKDRTSKARRPSAKVKDLNSILGAFAGAFEDIILTNLADEDVRSCGLTAVKATFVRRSLSN